ELGARDAEDTAVRDGDHARGARGAVEERELAERGAVLDFAELRRAFLDRELAARDDEERVARVALFDDRRASRLLDRLRDLGDRIELLAGEAGEERRIAQDQDLLEDGDHRVTGLELARVESSALLQPTVVARRRGRRDRAVRGLALRGVEKRDRARGE